VARRPRLGIDRREHRCECLAHLGCDWCRRPERRSVLRGIKCGQQCVCPSITNVRRLTIRSTQPHDKICGVILCQQDRRSRAPESMRFAYPPDLLESCRCV
jgi:hypothetical protein